MQSLTLLPAYSTNQLIYTLIFQTKDKSTLWCQQFIHSLPLEIEQILILNKALKHINEFHKFKETVLISQFMVLGNKLGLKFGLQFLHLNKHCTEPYFRLVREKRYFQRTIKLSSKMFISCIDLLQIIKQWEHISSVGC